MADADRVTGRVAINKGLYGFIYFGPAARQAYFKAEWCEDDRPLLEGDEVSFELGEYAGGKAVARSIKRQASAREDDPAAIPSQGGFPTASADPATVTNDADPFPRGKRLVEWAYLGHLPTTLFDLRDKALPERWEFITQPADPRKPLPILYGYLNQTFIRLAIEDKILIDEEARLAAFNTGLVDRRYEPIYALFTVNPVSQKYWKLAGFCTAAEDSYGQQLVRSFRPLPEPPHYFTDLSELIYDVRSGVPNADWEHIVIENIQRLPKEFIEENLPPGFRAKDDALLGDTGRSAYFGQLAKAISDNPRIYRRYIRAVKEAVELAIKRVAWNYRTAIPQYYPTVQRLQLLLPLCILSDDQVDLALAVERTDSGSYLGHTILPLDWAYNNARLICRPDSDWLSPDQIPLNCEESI